MLSTNAHKLLSVVDQRNHIRRGGGGWGTKIFVQTHFYACISTQKYVIFIIFQIHQCHLPISPMASFGALTKDVRSIND